MAAERCREEIWNQFIAHQCSRRAVTAAGYCRQHDPELKRQRTASRPPSKWARQMLVRKVVRTWIQQHLSPAQAEQLTTAIHQGWDSFVTPLWPLSDNIQRMARETGTSLVPEGFDNDPGPFDSDPDPGG